MLREAEVGQRSGAGSLIWAVLEPVFGIALLSLILMIALPAPPLGESFPLFYASGLMPLILFQDVSQKTTVALRYSRPFMGFAQVGIGDAIFARFLFSLLTQIVATSVVLLGIGAAAGTFWRFDPAQLVVAYLALICLSLGAGVFGCWMASIWSIWPRIWAVILRPLVFVSGVFFLVDEIGDPYRDWLMWNPLAHVISGFRSGIYEAYSGDLSLIWFVVICGFAMGFVGVIGLRLETPTLLDRLA